MARLYDKLSLKDKAANCFLESLRRKDEDNDTGKETVEAIMYLKNYYMGKEMFDEAAKYARKLYDFGGADLDKATSNIRDTEY